MQETDKVLGLLSATGNSPVMILHLRKSAWVDTTCTRHAHPFHYNDVVFFHNGTVYDYKGLIPAIKTPCREDALDTEVLFHHFMSAEDPELGRAFLDTVSTIKRREYRFSALNCVFSDGARLFAYRDYTKEPDYFSLYKAYREASCLISSQPLDDSIQWEMMGKGEFLAIEVG